MITITIMSAQTASDKIEATAFAFHADSTGRPTLTRGTGECVQEIPQDDSKKKVISEMTAEAASKACRRLLKHIDELCFLKPDSADGGDRS